MSVDPRPSRSNTYLVIFLHPNIQIPLFWTLRTTTSVSKGQSADNRTRRTGSERRPLHIDWPLRVILAESPIHICQPAGQKRERRRTEERPCSAQARVPLFIYWPMGLLIPNRKRDSVESILYFSFHFRHYILTSSSTCNSVLSRSCRHVCLPSLCLTLATLSRPSSTCRCRHHIQTLRH